MTTENSRADALTEAQRKALETAVNVLNTNWEHETANELWEAFTAPSLQPAAAPWRGACEHTTANTACRICREKHGDDYDRRTAPPVEQPAAAPMPPNAQLRRVMDLLDAHLGDSDPTLEGMTQEEIEEEFPVVAAMQIIVGLYQDPPTASDTAPSPADERAALWQTGTPPTKAGSYDEYIIAVRRKTNPARVFVFASNYANEYIDDNEDDEQKPRTGWYMQAADMGGEYAYVYKQTLNEGDEVLGWQALPKWNDEARAASANETGAEGATFQARVQPWMLACFGAEIAADRAERNHRFFEEAGELVQACGMTREEAHALVDYTWSRPVGEPTQEVGGVMVTLAALCLANGLDMHAAGETELARINVPETIEKIRAKQAAKPKHSPLPEAPRSPAIAAEAPEELPHWFEMFLTNVCELPDRNSPEGEPDAVVATLDELRNCALNAIEQCVSYAAPQPAQADAPASKHAPHDDPFKRSIQGISALLEDMRDDCVARLNVGDADAMVAAAFIMLVRKLVDRAFTESAAQASYDGNHVENQCPECSQYESECECECAQADARVGLTDEQILECATRRVPPREVPKIPELAFSRSQFVDVVRALLDDDRA